MPYSLIQKLTGELLGTALLLAIVIGSGMMGQRLASGNDAIALLAKKHLLPYRRATHRCSVWCLARTCDV